MRSKVLYRTMVLSLTPAATLALGATLGVPDPFPTIQSAIDAAVPGDTVLVQQGTYLEQVDFSGKSVVVTSVAPDESLTVARTVIDAGRAGSVVKFVRGESRDAVLRGFTITGGSGTVLWRGGGGKTSSGGGGILIQGRSSPWIDRCVISGNTVQGTGSSAGGGIYSSSSSPLITGCRIQDNRVSGGQFQMGGGVSIHRGSATLEDCRIARNRAGLDGGGLYGQGADVAVRRCRVEANDAFSGGGLRFVSARIAVERSTISGNTATWDGGGATFWSTRGIVDQSVFSANLAGTRAGGINTYEYNNPRIIHCTIADNSGGDAGGIMTDRASLEVLNSIVWGNDPNQIYATGRDPIVKFSLVQGRLDQNGRPFPDPRFRSPADGDYHLQSIACGDPADSPAIDAANPAYSDDELGCSSGLGSAVADMGAYGGTSCEIRARFEDVWSRIAPRQVMEYKGFAVNDCFDWKSLDSATVDYEGPDSLHRVAYPGPRISIPPEKERRKYLYVRAPGPTPLGVYTMTGRIYRDGQVIATDTAHVEVVDTLQAGAAESGLDPGAGGSSPELWSPVDRRRPSRDRPLPPRSDRPTP